MHAWRYALIIIFTLLVDQFSKGTVQSTMQAGESSTLIPNMAYLTHTQSGSGVPYTLILVWAAIWSFYKLIVLRKNSFMRGAPYALILCGSVGNIIDIHLYGYVLNIIGLSNGQEPFIHFNVADTIMVLAATLLTAQFLRSLYRTQSIGSEVSET